MVEKELLSRVRVVGLDELTKYRREISQVSKELKERRKATRNNIGAEKAAAKQTAELETRLKTLRAGYNRAQRATAEYNGVVNKTGSFTKKLTKSFVTAGLGVAGLSLGIGGAVQAIGSFLKSSVQLALRAEGVERAFGRLNQPGLLDQLQTATKGTVSNLQLMQRAVSAENLGVPVEQLATLFEFARRRAGETGQSVDFLTESIVNGLGRKSPLILDNLGISQVALREEIKKTGDFQVAAANIIQGELEGMGEDIDLNTDSVGRLSAAWENFQLSIGSQFTDELSGSSDLLSKILETLGRGKTIGDVFRDNLEVSVQNVVSAADSAEDLEHVIAAYKKQLQETNPVQGEYNMLQKQLAFVIRRLEEEQGKLNETQKIFNERIESFFGFGRKAVVTLGGMKQEQKSLREELDLAVPGTENFIEIQKDLEEITRKITDATGKETGGIKKRRQEQEKLNEALTNVVNILNGIPTEITTEIKIKAAQNFREDNEEEPLEDFENMDDIAEALGLPKPSDVEKLNVVYSELNEKFRKEIDQQNEDALDRDNERRDKEKKETEKLEEAKFRARQQSLMGISQIFSNASALAEQGSQEQKAFALASIIADQAAAISALVRASSQNPANAVTFGGAGAAQFISGLASITSGILQAKRVLSTSPVMARGGILEGPSHARGGIQMFGRNGQYFGEAQGGEAVINDKSTRMFAPLLNEINLAGGGRPLFQNGGRLSAVSGGGLNASELAMAIGDEVGRRVNGIKVVNNVEDTSRVGTRVRNIEQDATF